MIICSNSQHPKLSAELLAAGTRKVVEIRDDITLNLTRALIKNETVVYFTESIQEGLSLLEENVSLANSLEDIASASVVRVGGGLFHIDALPRTIQNILDCGMADVFVSPLISRQRKEFVPTSGLNNVRAS